MTLSPACHELMTHGPLVAVELRHHPASELSPKLTIWGEPEEPPSTTVPFLVDTGAVHSLIDRKIVDDLKIQPVHFIGEILTAASVLRDQPIYMVELRIKLKNGVVTLPTAVIGLQSNDLLAKSRYQGILGRHGLQKTRFVYDGAAGTFDIEVVRS